MGKVVTEGHDGSCCWGSCRGGSGECGSEDILNDRLYASDCGRVLVGDGRVRGTGRCWWCANLSSTFHSRRRRCSTGCGSCHFVVQTRCCCCECSSECLSRVLVSRSGVIERQRCSQSQSRWITIDIRGNEFDNSLTESAYPFSTCYGM